MTLTETEEDLLIYNIGIRGFTLTNFDYEIKREIIPINDLLIRTVRDYKEPRAMEGLATVIAKETPDYDKLVESAIKNGIQNQMGYILEGTLEVLRKRAPGDYSELEKAVKKLSKTISDGLPPLLTTIGMSNERTILSWNVRPEDLRWNIRGGVGFDQLDRQYCVYNGLQY